MIEKPVMFVFIVILLVFFLTGGVVVIGGVMKWYQISAQTHIIAGTMARYGHYNDTCEDSLQSFCERSNIKRSDLTLELEPADGGDIRVYGETVSVKILYPYHKRLFLGDMNTLFDYEIKTGAAAVSTFVPGLYVVP